MTLADRPPSDSPIGEARAIQPFLDKLLGTSVHPALRVIRGNLRGLRVYGISTRMRYSGYDHIVISGQRTDPECFTANREEIQHMRSTDPQVQMWLGVEPDYADAKRGMLAYAPDLLAIGPGGELGWGDWDDHHVWQVRYNRVTKEPYWVVPWANVPRHLIIACVP